MMRTNADPPPELAGYACTGRVHGALSIYVLCDQGRPNSFIGPWPNKQEGSSK